VLERVVDDEQQRWRQTTVTATAAMASSTLGDCSGGMAQSKGHRGPR